MTTVVLESEPMSEIKVVGSKETTRGRLEVTEEKKKTFLATGGEPAILYPDGDRLVLPKRSEMNAAVVTGDKVEPKYVPNNGVEIKINNVVDLAEKDPNGFSVNTPGAKMDKGKAPLLRGLLHYFPRALTHVSMVSQAGHDKGYPWKGWESVPEGVVRYGDALVRHLLAEEVEGLIDAKDTKMYHAAQVAWNALARLELILREVESKK